MPRILRILNRLIVGGPALHVLNLTHYTDIEFETRLIVGNKDDQEQGAEYLADKFNITPFYIPEMSRNINFINDIKSFYKIRKHIKEFKPDIVDTHGTKAGVIGRLAAFSMRVPVVIHTYHGHIFHSYFGKIKTKIFVLIEKILAAKTDAIITISTSQRNELLNEFKITRDSKIHTILLGFDLNKFQTNYKMKRERFRKEFGLAEDEIAIGIIGRLVPIKNQALFVDAISYVLRNTRKKIRAFIIGDGGIRKNLEQQCKNLSIPYTTALNIDYSSYKLIFTSWRNDIDVVNAGLDIITLTSLNEGTPVSLIEAQASNNPIVSTDVGGIRDILLQNDTALISDVCDSTKFKENLLRLIEDEVLRGKLGENGFEYVKDKFNFQRLISETEALYYDLLKKKKENKS
ncbi:MAG: glycosyltransferase family 4 protein [Ginsengibacter sp.]